MKIYQLQNFDVEAFIQNDWQRQPKVFRQVFPNFQDPLDEHELAGLAQEPDIDARIVSQSEGDWLNFTGPFDDFSDVCTGHWSLLVQHVDHYSEEAADLFDAFDFIPTWRKDDLMVSFSVPESGVGPHIDQYDVFIVQGKGQRRWQVGPKGDYPSVYPHPQLKQIEGFTPIIDEVLNPGDVLYIPPGFPHDGQALTECMNYSIGMRALNQQEALSGFADFVIDNNLGKLRYTDPSLLRSPAAEIQPQQLSEMRKLLHELVDSSQFSDWLAQQSSITRYDIEPWADEFSVQDLRELVDANTVFFRHPGTRIVMAPENEKASNHFHFFVNGQRYSAPSEQKELLVTFLTSTSWDPGVEADYKNCLIFEQLLTTMLTEGYWFSEE